MPVTRGFLLSCCTAGLIFAQAAPPKQLTARELFYAAPQTPAVKTATARPPARRAAHPPAKPVEIARADAPRPAAPQPATAPMPAGGAPPLGLRYTVLKLAADNTPTELPNDPVFHPAQLIPLRVQASSPCDPYTVTRDS